MKAIKKEKIPDVLGGIEERYVSEAAAYAEEREREAPSAVRFAPAKRKSPKLGRALAAAYLALKPGTYAFTCFNETTLETMRRVAPDAPLGYITGEWLSEKHIETARRIGCASVAPRLGGTTKEMIDAAHDAGLSVCCWMVQDESELREAREKGADRVTSDHPMKLLDLTRRP